MVGQAERPGGREKPENGIRDRRTEKRAHQAALERFVAQFVAVAYAKARLSDIEDIRLVDHLHTYLFLQIAPRPPVMVALAEIDFHSIVRQIRQSSEGVDIAGRHDEFSVVPEIEDVAEKEKRLRLGGQVLQEAHESPLALLSSVLERAKMRIGDEIV
jgi:hypothetical protein